MHAVAEYMYEHALEYNLVPDKMYVLGLLHDIGYIHEAVNHSLTGSFLLKGVGYELWDIVSWHGSTPAMYVEAKGVSFDEIPNELILLWTADLSIGPNGEEIGFSKRLVDIAKRYGVDSKQYQNAEDTISWLLSRNK